MAKTEAYLADGDGEWDDALRREVIVDKEYAAGVEQITEHLAEAARGNTDLGSVVLRNMTPRIKGQEPSYLAYGARFGGRMAVGRAMPQFHPQLPSLS